MTVALPAIGPFRNLNVLTTERTLSLQIIVEVNTLFTLCVTLTLACSVRIHGEKYARNETAADVNDTSCVTSWKGSVI